MGPGSSPEVVQTLEFEENALSLDRPAAPEGEKQTWEHLVKAWSGEFGSPWDHDGEQAPNGSRPARAR